MSLHLILNAVSILQDQHQSTSKHDECDNYVVVATYDTVAGVLLVVRLFAIAKFVFPVTLVSKEKGKVSGRVLFLSLSSSSWP